jgi:hypothetical protein
MGLEATMPPLDHFHSPWADENPWDGFHSAWVNTLVRRLNGGLLPPRFRAFPQVHLGMRIESDVATYDKGKRKDPVTKPAETNGGTATAVWSPPQPVSTLTVEFPDPDTFEVRIVEEGHGRRLVGAIELVSPANKDRPEHRSAFTAKCVAYLQEQVGLLIVDVVTEHHANLHEELLARLAEDPPEGEWPDLYAVAYRTRRDKDKWRLDTWPSALALGVALPTLPLLLTADFGVSIDLESTYVETCQVLRIE